MLKGIAEASCSERSSSMTVAKEKMVICVAGLTACGKSTAARRLAEKYGLTYVSGGTALKELALKMGYKAKNKGWWETQEGMRFLEERVRDPKFDRQIDAQLLEWADRGDVVLDSWTMPWLTKKGFKIWLEVSPAERAKRLAHRDGTNPKEAAQAIKEKDGKTRRIYEKIYGFKLGEDYSPFDLILDSESLSSEEVFDTLNLVIDRLVLKRSR
jgi:cytidylate kinase